MADFHHWKVPQLREYLIERGVTVSGHLKDTLVALCQSVQQLNLPVDPDFSSMNVKKSIEAKLQRVGYISDDPFVVKSGFSTDLSNVPPLTLQDIFNYLVCSIADFDGKRLRAWKSFNDTRLTCDGHVLKVEVNDSTDPKFVIYRANVKPTQRDTAYTKKPFYSCWVLITKLSNAIETAYCECKGGADGACRHVSAVLYEIKTWCEKTKSCTDGPKQWVKRPRPADEPCPLTDLPLKKNRTADEVTKPRRELENFDVRHPDDRDPPSRDFLKLFAASLKSLDKNTSVLELLEEDDQEEHQVIDQAAPGPDFINNFRIKHLLSSFIQTQDDGDHDLEQLFIDFIAANYRSSDSIGQVEKMTRGQSDNPLWLELRLGLITASNFHRVASRSETLKTNHEADPSALLNSLMTSRNIGTIPAVEWGKQQEPKAKELYMELCQTIHKGFLLSETGLFLCMDNPFLGCSPDGVATCSCSSHDNNKWLIEVKCPYEFRDAHPNEAALKRGCCVVDGCWTLDKAHPFYTQVQGQLGICGLSMCMLIIYTARGILPVTVPFDQKFYSALIHKLLYFAENFLFPHLLSQV